MATKKQITDALLPKQVEKEMLTLKWDDVVYILDEINGHIGTNERAKIITAIKKKDYVTVGKILTREAYKKKSNDAKTKLQSYLANNALDLDELGEVLL